MRNLRIIIGIISLLIAVQAVGLLLLAILIYQSTPNSVLARDTFIAKIPGVLSTVRLLDRSMNMWYWGPKSPEELPLYSLRISKESLAAIEEALPTELPSPWYGNLFLNDDSKEWADAVFTEGNESYDVKIRVRGDIFNHWAYRKKSWRIRFPSEKLFHGMREVNFILPEDRAYFAEPLNVYRAQQMNLLHPPMQFVQVSINGQKPALYTQVEHWTKEMVEKQGRTGDANLYQTSGGTSYFQQWNPAFDEIAYWDKYLTRPNQDSYEEIDQLLQLSKEGAHNQPNYVQKLKSIVNVDKVVSWYVLSELAGSRHVTDFNVRMYFDPSAGKFEPVPWDIHIYVPKTLLSLPGNAFLNEVFRVPTLKLQAHRMLWEHVNNDDTVAADLAEAQRLRSLMERAAYRDPLKLQSNRQVRNELDKITRDVKWNLDFIKDELKISEVLVAERIPSNRQQERGVVLTLDLTARGVAQATLQEIQIPDALVPALRENRLELWRDNGSGGWGEDDTRIAIQEQNDADNKGKTTVEVAQKDAALLWTGDPVLDANGAVVTAPHQPHRFFLVVRGGERIPDDAYPLKLDIRNAVTGKKADVIGDVLVDERTFERLPEAYMTREAFLQKYPFFTAEGDKEVVWRGNHIINSVIIVPSTVSLRIQPGTVVRMAPGASVISYAPVSMIGAKEAPIVFEAEKPEESWGVFAVLNASSPSFVQWANFSGGSETYINGTFFSGMVDFYNSPVTITDSVIANAKADDGLNLKYVYVDVNRVRFDNNSADGLDIDFALSGAVENSLFINNGNDGLDISGSPIVIRNIEVNKSGDKCISVGEGSAPLIYDTTLKGCNYGVAVKDDSHAKIERVLFDQNNIAVSAYIKKPFFAAPSVVVIDSTFRRNGENTQALSGAVITVDSAQ